MMVRSALDMVGFVQPMPDGGVLIASVRRPHDAVVSAERWSAQGGTLIAQADFGDAIRSMFWLPIQVPCGLATSTKR